MLTGPIWYSAGLPQRGNYPFSLGPRRPGKMARRDDRGSRLSGLGGGSRSGGEQMSQKRIEVQLTIRARAKMQRVTWATFLRSKRSAVWKISSSGTPYFLIAAWNLGKGKTDWVGLGTASDFDYMIATIAATHMSLSTLSLSSLSRASTPLRSLHQAAGRRAANKASPPLIDGGCPASE